MIRPKLVEYLKFPIFASANLTRTTSKMSPDPPVEAKPVEVVGVLFSGVWSRLSCKTFRPCCCFAIPSSYAWYLDHQQGSWWFRHPAPSGRGSLAAPAVSCNKFNVVISHWTCRNCGGLCRFQMRRFHLGMCNGPLHVDDSAVVKKLTNISRTNSERNINFRVASETLLTTFVTS